ncbi:bifunctional adenosylcobinamide kinase/adenosylcobinamide-phosphate guanylyltransferase [Aestuariimicrobium kwangyangense]|uniref:bifunctional adenosylcobinamide kinase/adenosylcobinamide-phosphate guanylyltransferase n=1 Tax=Aestuariimicrobium kwangyangense TaxID=396389 RepID=UPI001FE18531|nr:bifunctional adenosylcobinamide kinase/adenosylcobinamide-phosphate guanylyltransferase [Aestuariimicrobium kwangyangense]
MTRVLVTGSSRSGKSRAAESLLGGRDTDYVATGFPPSPEDPEWAVLVDCLSLWLTRVMDRHGAWVGPTPRLGGDIDGLVAAVRTTARDVVLVTNEVGWGVVPDHRSGGSSGTCWDCSTRGSRPNATRCACA